MLKFFILSSCFGTEIRSNFNEVEVMWAVLCNTECNRHFTPVHITFPSSTFWSDNIFLMIKSVTDMQDLSSSVHAVVFKVLSQKIPIEEKGAKDAFDQCGLGGPSGLKGGQGVACISSISLFNHKLTPVLIKISHL